MKENRQIQQLNGRTGGIYYAFTIALFVIVSFIGQAIMRAIVDKNSTVYIAVCSTFSALSFFAVIIYAWFYKKVQKSNVVGQGFGVKYIPLALILACGMFFALGYVNEAIAQIFIGWGLNASGISVPLTSPLHFVYFSITLALLPAIAEELFFRGIILSSLSGAKKVYAVLVSGLCFALYHCSVAQLVYQFIYGVALGFLFISAKSVFPCIIAHFANNFTILCLEYLKVSINLFNVWIILIGATCLAIFSAVVFLVYKNRKNKETVQEKNNEIQNFLVPYAILAFVVCITLAVGSLVG